MAEAGRHQRGDRASERGGGIDDRPYGGVDEHESADNYEPDHAQADGHEEAVRVERRLLTEQVGLEGHRKRWQTTEGRAATGTGPYTRAMAHDRRRQTHPMGVGESRAYRELVAK